MSSSSLSDCNGNPSRIEFTSLVDSAKLIRVRTSLQPNWALRSTTSWTEFEHAARGGDGVLILDPPLDHRSGAPVHALTNAVRSFLQESGNPIVVYTDAKYASAVAPVPVRGVLHLVLAGIDDEPEALRYHLAQAICERTKREITDALIASGSDRNRDVLAAIAQLLDSDRDVASVSELARVWRMSRSALYRVVKKCGIDSPTVILDVLNISRFHRLTTVHGLTTRAACVAMGIQDARSLRRTCRAVLGATHLRDVPHVSVGTLAEQFTSFLTRKKTLTDRSRVSESNSR